MAKAFPLQMLLDMTMEKRDDAAKVLGQLIASERSAQEKLDMLLQFRAEYRQRMQEATRGGIGLEQLRNYNAFLARLDEAVLQQESVVNRMKQATAAGQQVWIEHRNKVKAFDTLAERHADQQARIEAKQEQKFSDEHAAKQFRLRKQEEAENAGEDQDNG